MGVTGMNGIQAAFNRLQVKVQEEIKDAVEETVLNIQRKAIRNAPAAGDRIATTYGSQQINTGISQFIYANFTNGGLVGEVGIDARASTFAIFVEFRTGTAAASYVATLPAEFQAVARKYYVNGLGKIIGHPFLLPAYFEERAKFVERLKEALKNSARS